MSRRVRIPLIVLAPLAYTLSFGQNQTNVDLPRRSASLMEALRSTIEINPSIQEQEQQVNLNRGILKVASGQFDTTYTGGISQSHSYTPLTGAQLTTSLTANNTLYSVSAQKPFRNGLAIEPSVTLTRDTDNLSAKNGVDRSQISFQVSVPLLRGRGRDAVDSQEISSKSALDASLYDVNSTIAQLLANTAISYWNAVAAAQNLQIALDSEQRGLKYVQDVQTLIDADKVAKSEINQLIANLDTRTATRIAAEQGVINAQQSLALAMGLNSEQILVLPEPKDPLPDWPVTSIPKVTPQLTEQFVQQAMKARPDLIAAKLRQQAAAQLLPAARNQLLPQLNLTLNTGYNGLTEGTGFGKAFVAPFKNAQGLNASGAINFTFPPRNDVALGQFAQTEASYQQQSLLVGDLARNISSNVITALSALSNSIAALRKAKDGVAYSRVALDDEQEKFRLGISQLVNVLTLEDRLTNALLQELSARLNYALAIENLRLATGTVIDSNLLVHKIDEDIFTQPPSESLLLP